MSDLEDSVAFHTLMDSLNPLRERDAHATNVFQAEIQYRSLDLKWIFTKLNLVRHKAI